MPVANVCPHCDALVPVKQEHMYMRTRKVTCPELQEAVPSRRSLAGARPGAADGEAGVGAASRSAATSPTSSGTRPASCC